jgi:hypothetical protein
VGQRAQMSPEQLLAQDAEEAVMHPIRLVAV